MSKEAMFVGGPWNGKSTHVTHGTKYVEVLEHHPHNHGFMKHSYEYLTTSLDGIDVYVLASSIGSSGYWNKSYGPSASKLPYGSYKNWDGPAYDYTPDPMLKDKEQINPSIQKPIEPPIVSEKEPLKFTVTMENVDFKTAALLTGQKETEPLAPWEIELLEAEHGKPPVSWGSIDEEYDDDLDDLFEEEEIKFHSPEPISAVMPIDESDPEYVQEQAEKAKKASAGKEALKKAQKYVEEQAAKKAMAKHVNMGIVYGAGVGKFTLKPPVAGPIQSKSNLKGHPISGSYMDEIVDWKPGPSSSGL